MTTTISGTAGLSGNMQVYQAPGPVLVVLAEGTTLYSSRNLSTWSSTTTPGFAYFSLLAYGGGTFIAYTGNDNGANRTATSSDGITWQLSANLPTFSSWISATYGDGAFVAIADRSTNSAVTNNAAAYSTDLGQSWTASTLPGANLPWQKVVYGNGTFLAIQNNGTAAATSDDGGANWTQRTLPVSGQWHAAGFGNNTFVALSGSGNRAIRSTDNGVTWANATITVSPENNYWLGIAYGGGTFIAVSGLIGSNNITTVRSTDDGVTWTRGGDLPAASWDTVEYVNGYFIATDFLARSISADFGMTWANLPANQTLYSRAIAVRN